MTPENFINLLISLCLTIAIGLGSWSMVSTVAIREDIARFKMFVGDGDKYTESQAKSDLGVVVKDVETNRLMIRETKDDLKDHSKRIQNLEIKTK